jgi:hypothetical protein
MSDELNGEATAQAPGPINNRINHQLVALLRNALRDAEAGRIIAGGFIAVLDPGLPIPFIVLRPGSLQGACELIAGAEVLKAHVVAKVNAPQQSVLRAANMPRQ